MKELGKHIGKKIREARSLKNFTQDVLARKIGTDKSYIGHLETGLKVPSLKLLSKLSDNLNVPFSYFFDDAMSPKDIKRITPNMKRIVDRLKYKNEEQMELIISLLDLLEKY